MVARRRRRPVRARGRRAWPSARRSPARPPAVRRRSRRVVRVRPGPDGRAARAAEPRPARAARPGADADRRAGGVRSPQAHDHGDRECLRGRRSRCLVRARGPDDRGGAVAAGRAGSAPPEASGPRPDGGAAQRQHDSRPVRGQRRPDHRIHLRRRRVPGGPVAALVRAGAGRGVLDLPRAARGQPEPVHVLPGLRRLRDRRRKPGAADHGRRSAGFDATDRRHAAARRHRRRRQPDRRGAAGRSQGAGRARDAGRPRAQRPRAGVRVRIGRGRRASWRSRTTAT